MKTTITTLRPLFMTIVATAAALLPAKILAAPGDLFVAEFDGSIFKFTPHGTKTTFASGLGNPEGLAFDSAGNLFVADFGRDMIFKFAPDGTKTTFASGLRAPVGLAFDSSGNLFEADAASGTIFKFTRNGTKSTFASGLGNPLGLAFDSAGNLFVAGGSSGAIFKFTSNGTKSTFASGLNFAEGLAFDSAGNLFVDDALARTIFKFTPGGTKSFFASGVGAGILGLAFDSSGNLFVAGFSPPPNNGTIFKFAPDGTKTTFASGLTNLTGLAFEPATTLGNISTRAFVQTADKVMIGGFIIEGAGPKTVILRAIGPELVAPPFNIPNALSNPALALYNGNAVLIAQNDNWQTTILGGIITASQVSAIQNSGHAPTQPTESAIIATLQPGNYTAIVRGYNNAVGVALVEVYDLSSGTASILGNISTRSFVQTGDNVMIGGFIVQGVGRKRVIIRAIGPELRQHGVPNPLANPILELHNGTGSLIATNDDWQTTIIGGIIGGSQVSDIQNSGHAPTEASESAIIANLQPGNYTAIVRGVNNTTGTALVEVYDLGQ